MHTEQKLSVTEVAERLGVHPRTIRRWIQSGEFPNARRVRPIRRSPFRIPMSDVIAFEARRDSGDKRSKE